MTDGVKRSYDASGRREAARANRRAVVSAARELLESRGYAATTIADVARRAGVSAESIYKSFGTKAALTKEVFDLVIGGDDDRVAVADRPESRAVRDEPDVREKLRLFARGAAVRAERSAPLQLVIRNGAPSDPALAELWAALQTERLAGMAALAAHLAATGRLRTGTDEARDVLWAAIAVEVYDLLVLQRGWTRDAYAAWLTSTLLSNLT